MTNPTASPDPHAVVRTLAVALSTAPVLVLVALLFVLPTTLDDAPPLPVAAGLVGLVALGVVAAETLGFRTRPLSPSEHADQSAARSTALARYQSLMMVRFALVEAAVIVGIALSFVLDHAAWPAIVTIVLGTPAMVLEVWPSRRNVARVATRLEADGVRSGLTDAFPH